jgi:isochorismate hydrolase
MKERYFTTQNLVAKSTAMLTELAAHRRRRRPLALDRVALLVLDMQDYFLAEESHAFLPSAPAIVPGVRKLVSAIAAQACPVIFTRHLNTGSDAGMMGRWWPELILADDPLSQISHRMDTSLGAVQEKPQYDAFFDTELHQALTAASVRQVVITGVKTHLCCETTARSAFVHGYEVVFVVDGTATDNELHHLATLRNLSHGFANVATVHEVLAGIGHTNE